MEIEQAAPKEPERKRSKYNTGNIRNLALASLCHGTSSGETAEIALQL